LSVDATFRRNILSPSSGLKMETVCFSETLDLPTSLDGAKTQKIIIFTAVETSNLTLSVFTSSIETYNINKLYIRTHVAWKGSFLVQTLIKVYKLMQ
jgi:hypothetical protein